MSIWQVKPGKWECEDSCHACITIALHVHDVSIIVYCYYNVEDAGTRYLLNKVTLFQIIGRKCYHSTQYITILTMACHNNSLLLGGIFCIIYKCIL